MLQHLRRGFGACACSTRGSSALRATVSEATVRANVPKTGAIMAAGRVASVFAQVRVRAGGAACANPLVFANPFSETFHACVPHAAVNARFLTSTVDASRFEAAVNAQAGAGATVAVLFHLAVVTHSCAATSLACVSCRGVLANAAAVADSAGIFCPPVLTEGRSRAPDTVVASFTVLADGAPQTFPARRSARPPMNASGATAANGATVRPGAVRADLLRVALPASRFAHPVGTHGRAATLAALVPNFPMLANLRPAALHARRETAAVPAARRRTAIRRAAWCLGNVHDRKDDERSAHFL